MPEQLALDLFPRHAAQRVADALTDTRVVVVSGARQVGKSTLAQLTVDARQDAAALYLDEPAVREAAEFDPAGFVRHDGLLMIDEIQRAPELLLPIKNLIDRDPRPGRFLLTGSAQLWAMRDLPDLLPGRSETVTLWPLSQGEIGGYPDGFVDAVFSEPAPYLRRSGLNRIDYIGRALQGGFPEAVRRKDPRRRERFFESYIADIIDRDVRQVSEITKISELRKIVQALAAVSGAILVPNRLSSDLGISGTTVRRHIDALEIVYLIHKIPAWSSNLTSRVTAKPRVAFVDSGLAGHLTGMTVRRAAHPTSPVGSLMETFVLSELARQLTWSEERVSLFHYRDRENFEVDAVLERASGEIVGIEVKAAESVRADDFRGLRRLAAKAGDRFQAGYVLYAGAEVLPFGEGMRAAPISSLWTTPSPYARP